KNLLHIPDSLPGNITCLDLSFNSLAMPRSGTFLVHFPSLHALNLSNNVIPTLYPAVFSNLRVLHLLDLSSCNISHLHPKAFQGMRNLHTLLLKNNKLRILRLSVLLSFGALVHLDLRNNDLITVDALVLQLMDRTHQVLLQGNPHVCNCSMYLFQQWLRLRRGEERIEGRATMSKEEGLKDNALKEVSHQFPCHWHIPKPCCEKGYLHIMCVTHKLFLSLSCAAATTSPAGQGGNSWPYLVGFLASAVGISLLIALAAKCKLFHKHFASSRHQPLPDTSSVGGSRAAEGSPWGENQSTPRAAELQLEEEDGFIEDNYIQPSEQLQDE
uniref:LRRCT domain-containing protein n=1 Tax=Pelodiscus sinensis TaxID=13735 RepID=K7FNB5_PELSI